MWEERAACLDVDTDVFFPPAGSGGWADGPAKRVCATCGVRQACLDAELAAQPTDVKPFGVRGGLSARERRGMTFGARAPVVVKINGRPVLPVAPDERGVA